MGMGHGPSATEISFFHAGVEGARIVSGPALIAGEDVDILRPHQSFAVAEIGGGHQARASGRCRRIRGPPSIARGPGRSVAMCSVPWRSSDDAVITTSAPASRYLTTSSAVVTPPVAVSEASTRPASSAIHRSAWRIS